MADEKPKTVTVEALQDHSYAGQDYVVGDTYDIDEQLVDSVTFQGKAVRVDRAEVAKKARTAAAKRSTAVEPMSTSTTRTATRAKGSRKSRK